MILLQSDELPEHIESLIHLETQQHDKHIDLTVDTIFQYHKTGALDFGGSEFEPAEKRTLAPQKRNTGDDYGWWHLSEGTYQAVFNEMLKDFEDTIALLTPHRHARQTGIIANTTVVSDPQEENRLTMNFTVPQIGCNIKENARFATLYLFTK